MEISIKIRTVSDIWTGGVVIGQNSSLRNSGIIGSLRWWYETTVRSLGGYACSPLMEEGACPDSNGKRCPACMLFGCTGWSRRFKLRIENDAGMIVQGPLKEGHAYVFRLIFANNSRSEEIWLLVKIIERIIAPYGSIGGKMPNKPSEHAFKIDNPSLSRKQNKNHHRDFGLIDVLEISGLSPSDYSKEAITDFLSKYKYEVKDEHGNIKDNDLEWPSLDHLFSVKAEFSLDCFHRLDINKLIGENPDNSSAVGYCLKGKKGSSVLPAKSKDIFAFRAGRIWGYCRDDTVRNKVAAEIRDNLNDKTLPITIREKVIGSELVEKLFK